jgi:hypothetical protein
MNYRYSSVYSIYPIDASLDYGQDYRVESNDVVVVDVVAVAVAVVVLLEMLMLMTNIFVPSVLNCCPTHRAQFQYLNRPRSANSRRYVLVTECTNRIDDDALHQDDCQQPKQAECSIVNH